MKEFEFKYEGITPEQLDLEFYTNGSQGGDGGHGGYASLILSNNKSSQLSVLLDDNGLWNDVDKIEIRVDGDFELAGFAIALVELAKSLLSNNDVLEEYIRWNKQ